MRISHLVDVARDGAGAPTQCAGAFASAGIEARRQQTFEAKSLATCAELFIGELIASHKKATCRMRNAPSGDLISRHTQKPPAPERPFPRFEMP